MDLENKESDRIRSKISQTSKDNLSKIEEKALKEWQSDVSIKIKINVLLSLAIILF